MDAALIERALKDADRVIESYMEWARANHSHPYGDMAREQITSALIELRKVPTCEPANVEVEAAVNAFIADRENLGLPTYISKSSWRNHIQAALTAAALWRKERDKGVVETGIGGLPGNKGVAGQVDDAFRAGAEAMREECAKVADRYMEYPRSNTNSYTGAVIRSLPLPTPKGEKT